jgi:hypothetical protein
MVIVLAILPNVRRFKPGRVRWTFKIDTYPQHAFIRRGSKAVGACRKMLRHVKEP